MDKDRLFYTSERQVWRAWLAAHFETEPEIWFVFPMKGSGEESLSYNDAVEEALCFGWIDSTIRHIDPLHRAQRFTPRRPGSPYSRPNIERLKWLDARGLIHPRVRPSLEEILHAEFQFPEDILDAIRRDRSAWEHFTAFPEPYKRIRVAYIEAARKRPDEFQKRLSSFIRKTRENKLIKGYGGVEKYYGNSPCPDAQAEYLYEEFPLERNGVALHLDCVKMARACPGRDILLIHGVTYSSHEFDIDYRDYSLVRLLARAGYAVWRLDVAGFGRSGEVEDGFLPDSDYAAEDIRAAVEKILRETGRDRLDLLGWSWGTVTAGRFAAAHPERIDRLVLFAPILCGLGAEDVTEPFHPNTREHAAEDFQRGANGAPDPAITDPVLVERWCESCLKYDGEWSPNGGRRDLCVPESETLIDLEKLRSPTLILCGDRDPYLRYDRIERAIASLPEGSALEMIAGASHAAFVEKPFYRDFQNRLLRFLGV